MDPYYDMQHVEPEEVHDWLQGRGKRELDEPAERIFDVVVPDDPKEKLGLRFLDIEVIKVTPGCWAHKNGVQQDDEIHAINDSMFEPLDEGERYKALTQKRPFTVQFKRPLHKDTYFVASFKNEAGRRQGRSESGMRRLGFKYYGDVVVDIEGGSWAQNVGMLCGVTTFRLISVSILPRIWDDELLAIWGVKKRWTESLNRAPL